MSRQSRYHHWGYPAPWMHRAAPGGSDHLYNFITSAGALATILGLIVAIVGGIMAILYSRKATATISGELVTTDSGSIVVVRPSLYALGPFKLMFAKPDGAVVQVTPVLTRDEDGTSTDDDNAKRGDAFPPDEMGNAQFVSPGETLTSSRYFRVDPSTPRLLGWLVSFNVTSAGGVRRGLSWADRVFVPVKFPRREEPNMTEQEKGKPIRDDGYRAAKNKIHPTDGADDDGGPAEVESDEGQAEPGTKK